MVSGVKRTMELYEIQTIEILLCTVTAALILIFTKVKFIMQ